MSLCASSYCQPSPSKYRSIFSIQLDLEKCCSKVVSSEQSRLALENTSFDLDDIITGGGSKRWKRCRTRTGFVQLPTTLTIYFSQNEKNEKRCPTTKTVFIIHTSKSERFHPEEKSGQWVADHPKKRNLEKTERSWLIPMDHTLLLKEKEIMGGRWGTKLKSRSTIDFSFLKSRLLTLTFWSTLEVMTSK